MKDVYENKSNNENNENNEQPVYLVLLVDASGSMASRKVDTIKGCRNFLIEQCKELEE